MKSVNDTATRVRRFFLYITNLNFNYVINRLNYLFTFNNKEMTLCIGIRNKKVNSNGKCTVFILPIKFKFVARVTKTSKYFKLKKNTHPLPCTPLL